MAYRVPRRMWNHLCVSTTLSAKKQHSLWYLLHLKPSPECLPSLVHWRENTRYFSRFSTCHMCHLTYLHDLLHPHKNSNLHCTNIKNFTFAFNQYRIVRHPALSLNISYRRPRASETIWIDTVIMFSKSAHWGRRSKALAASKLKPCQDIFNRCTIKQLLSFILFLLPSFDVPSLHNLPLFPVTADVRKPAQGIPKLLGLGGIPGSIIKYRIDIFVPLFQYIFKLSLSAAVSIFLEASYYCAYF